MLEAYALIQHELGAGTGRIGHGSELAGYCIHTLTAASDLSTKAAVRRLVAVTLDGLRPPH